MYTVYKITNEINNRIYVGVHKTDEVDDGYMGSGKAIRLAIKKYGRDNFTKEILATFVNRDSAFLMESTIVDEEFVMRNDTYNMKPGGFGGGVGSGENNPLFGKTFSDEHRAKLSAAKSGENHPLYGKTLSEETKAKMSAAHSGEKNTQFGKTLSAETRIKLSAAKIGKTHTEETKKKMSDARKEYHRKRREQQ